MSASVSSRAAPGELAQHEHAPLVRPRRHELLGHEVHPVVQAAHVADVRRAEVAEDRGRLVVRPQQHDGPVGTFGPPGVDALREGLDAVVEGLVPRDPRAAGSRELGEGEAPAQFGVTFEQGLHRSEALLDALGVVKAVDAHAQQRVGREVELAPHGRGALRGGGEIVEPAHGPFDGDGVRPDERTPRALHDGVVLPVDARLDERVDRVEEVVAVLLRVEPDDARPQQPFDELIAPGADAHALGVGPGDVPERDDGRAREAGADHRGGEGEVVVLHEDDGVVRVDLVADGVSEALVDLAVLLPVRGTKLGARVGDVTEGPESLVGEAVVVPGLLLLGEPHPAHHVRLLPGRHLHPVAGVRRLAVGRTASMRDPHARARAHHRLERRHQPARRVHDAGASARGLLVDVRLAVGDDHHPLALEVLRQDAAQTVGAPVSAARVGLAVLRQARDQLADVPHQGLKLTAAVTPQCPSQVVLPAAPREARGDRRDAGGGQREHEERDQELPPGGGLAPGEEAEVVDEHDEAAGREPGERDAVEAHRPAGEVDVEGPAAGRLGRKALRGDP